MLQHEREVRVRVRAARNGGRIRIRRIDVQRGNQGDASLKATDAPLLEAGSPDHGHGAAKEERRRNEERTEFPLMFIASRRR